MKKQSKEIQQINEMKKKYNNTGGPSVMVAKSFKDLILSFYISFNFNQLYPFILLKCNSIQI